MKKTFLLFCILSIACTALKSQHHIGLYINGSSPLKPLADSGYRNGIGFSFEYLSPSLFFKTKSLLELRVGAGIEFLHYGSSRKVDEVIFNTPNNDRGTVKLQNQMLGLYVAPKLIFNIGKVSPYIDVFGALRAFNSYQVNRFNREVQGYERSTTTSVKENPVAHYGGSLGLLYNINKTVTFDARFSYSTGSAINFVDLNSPTKDALTEKQIKYRTTSATFSDVFIFRIGVLLRITPSRIYDNTPTRRDNIILTPATPAPRPAEVKPIPPTPNY